MSDSSEDLKPGRKPTLAEPKNKRTAQNRAAQRAFRERKERKLKELEEQVELLENEKIAAVTESEFLKKQVEMLMTELTRARSDGASPTALLALPPKPSPDAQEFAFDFPWSQKGLHLSVAASQSSLSVGSKTAPASVLSYSSPDDDQQLLSHRYKSQEQGYNHNKHFDEQVNAFCGELGTVCGTREAPVPTYEAPGLPLHRGSVPSRTFTIPTPRSTDSTPSSDSYSAMINGTAITKPQTNPHLGLEDPALGPFFKDSPGFGDMQYGSSLNLFEAGGLDTLVSEVSAYDPLEFGDFSGDLGVLPAQSTFAADGKAAPLLNAPSFNSPATSSFSAGLESYLNLDEEVVPSKDQNLLRCSEIWDRITSHPKYTELDIDGLCHELKAKAKCSEKGPVVDHSEVDRILDMAANSGHDELYSERFAW